MNKETARKLSITNRKSIILKDRNTKSLIITNKVMSLIKDYDDVLIYSSINSEVDTKDLINTLLNEKRLFLPKVNGENMNFYKIDNINQLAIGYMDIKEPSYESMEANKDNFNDNSVIIIPGAAFDLKGNRVGYGKGYYDRYLTKYPKLIKMALAYEEQIVDVIENDIYDIPMDYIITDKRIIRINE